MATSPDASGSSLPGLMVAIAHSLRSLLWREHVIARSEKHPQVRG